MKYDFDELVPRRGTNSYKWDSDADSDVLPMWVADMDFRTAPAITDSLTARASQGIFGYTRVPDSYYKAVCDWFASRHGWTIDSSAIIYTSGVVPAISAIIKALTSPGDKVLVQTPVYNCFFSSIRNNRCAVDANPLIYSDLTYTMDFDNLERRTSDPSVRLMLLCNPHNPAGRVWTRDELAKVRDICRKNKVRVVSDEIHCELTMPGFTYTPYATVDPEAIVCVSPSKAFNLAGLQIANIVCPDADTRRLIDRAINDNEVCDVNPFGVIATEAAYRHGTEWLEQLIEYLWDNYRFMQDFCRDALPTLPITRLEGTYLVWMDCRSLPFTSDELERKLLADAKLWLNAGNMYGEDGEGFMRWNIACPRAVLAEGLNRFADFVSEMNIR
jgi:cystathionine beta-lyase